MKLKVNYSISMSIFPLVHGIFQKSNGGFCPVCQNDLTWLSNLNGKFVARISHSNLNATQDVR